MRRPYPTLLAIAVVIAAMTGYGLWRHDRIERCVDRADRLLTVPFLNAAPQGWSGEQGVAGCDVDRASTYAVRYVSRQAGGFAVAQAYPSATEIRQKEETAFAEASGFYRQAAERDGWTVGEVDTRDTAVRGVLCAEKDHEGGPLYLRVSTAGSGAFEVMLSEAEESGVPCL